MARSISKGIATAKIMGLDPSKAFETDENGMPKANVVVETNGNPSQAKALRILQAETKSKNVMVLDIQVDETKVSVDADTFYVHSNPCVEDVTYGHDTITQTFRDTVIEGFYVDKEGMHQFSEFYIGVTTMNKLLNYVREATGCNNACITSTEVRESRRWMFRSEYMKLAQS